MDDQVRPEVVPPLLQLKQLVSKANVGDAAALASLREILDHNPGVWQRMGDLSLHTELTLIRIIAGDDSLLTESLQRKLDDLKTQLSGPSPSPLQKLAVARVVTTLLQVEHVDALVAKAKPGTIEGNFLLKRQHLAARQYQAATHSLATLQHLLPVEAASAPKTTSTAPTANSDDAHGAVTGDRSAETTGLNGHEGVIPMEPFTGRMTGT